jgi:nitrous oxidase accessory protein NosD
MRRLSLQSLLLIAVLTADRSGATVIEVPAEQPTIQAGIDAAEDGDTLLVAAGIYEEQIDFTNKSIVLLGNSSLDTAIDGSGAPGSVVRFSGGEGPETLLAGFTITGGRGDIYNSGPHGGESRAGGGIYCNPGANATLRDCSIRGNRVTAGNSRGGGIYIDGAQLLLDNCRIRGNEAQVGGGVQLRNSSLEILGSWLDGNDGTAVYAEDASDVSADACTLSANQGDGIVVINGDLELTDCIIRDNVARFGGVGIQTWNGTIAISNCTIRDNRATDGGALGVGLSLSRSTGVVSGCEIRGNRAEGYGDNQGAGIHVGGPATYIQILDCIIEENDAGPISGSGGGIGGLDDATMVIRNCTIRYNHAGRRGGAIFCQGMTTEISDCLLDFNRGEDTGGAVYAAIGTDLTISGSSLARNSSDRGGAIGQASFGSGGISISRCTLAQNQAPTGSVLWGGGEPVALIDCILWGGDSAPVAGSNVEISYSDIEGGHPGTGNIDTDPLFCDAECRLIDLGLTATSPCLGAGHEGGDMGAFGLSCEAPVEHTPANVEIPADYPSIQAAIDASCPGDTLTLSPGIYNESGLDLGTHSLYLRGTAPDDWAVVEATVITAGDGDHPLSFHSGAVRISGISLKGGEDGIHASNATLFVDHLLLQDDGAYGIRATSMTLDGSDLRVESFGEAGILVDSGTMSLRDCEFHGGHGNAIEDRFGQVWIERVSVYDSRDVGIFLDSSQDALITDSSFIGCDGAISASHSGPLQLSRCVGDGGANGLSLYYVGDATVDACIFANCYDSGIDAKFSTLLARSTLIYGNSAWEGAGVSLRYGSSARLENCTLVDNESWGGGVGGLYCNDSDAVLVNCILWNLDVEEIRVQDGTLEAGYCDIRGGWPGAGNLDLDPLFASYAEHDYLLAPASPLVDAGDPSTSDAISDWHPRWPAWYPNSAAADMGAYGGEQNALWLP